MLIRRKGLYVKGKLGKCNLIRMNGPPDNLWCMGWVWKPPNCTYNTRITRTHFSRITSIRAISFYKATLRKRKKNARTHEYDMVTWLFKWNWNIHHLFTLLVSHKRVSLEKVANVQFLLHTLWAAEVFNYPQVGL